MSEALKLPAIPQTKDDLLIAALRHADDVSGLLNEIAREAFSLEEKLTAFLQVVPEGGEGLGIFSPLHDLLCQRCAERSGLFLFIAAGNLGIQLPADMQDDAEEPGASEP